MLIRARPSLRQALAVALAVVACYQATASAQLADGEAVADEPSYSRKGADTCLGCHDDIAMLQIFRTAHGRPGDPRSPFGHGQLQCEACHGPGGDHAGRVRRGDERPPMLNFGKDPTTPVEVQNRQCESCHRDDTGFAWHGGPHEMANVACAGCHVVHAETDPVRDAATQSQVCFDCHREQRTQAMKPFGHPLRQGKMNCTSCHSPHGATTDGQFIRQTANDTCFQCHAELRGPFLWEHAPATEDCGNCHEPHGSNFPGMLSMRAPLLCQGCHAQSGHPSLPQDARGLPSAMPSQYLLGQGCLNCHTQVHGSNHPSGSRLMR